MTGDVGSGSQSTAPLHGYTDPSRRIAGKGNFCTDHQWCIASQTPDLVHIVDHDVWSVRRDYVA